MIRGYFMVGSVVHFLMHLDGVSVIGFSAKELHRPEIGELFQMFLPIFDDGIEEVRQGFVGSYFRIKAPDELRHIFSVFYFLHL